MRMWMVEPRVMCEEHLQREHNQLHLITDVFGNHSNGKSVFKGLVSAGKIDLDKVVERHDELVEEFERRGYFHNTPMAEGVGLDWGEVDEDRSLDELLERCNDCRDRIKQVRA